MEADNKKRSYSKERATFYCARRSKTLDVCTSYVFVSFGSKVTLLSRKLKVKKT